MKSNTSEVMSINMITAQMTDSLENAYSKMKEKKIRQLPVIDCDQVVGIISDKDLSPIISGGVVQDFMNTQIISVPYNTEIISVIQRMINEKISAAMITTENIIVGMVSHDDLKRIGKNHVKNWFSKTSIGAVAHSLSLV